MKFRVLRFLCWAVLSYAAVSPANGQVPYSYQSIKSDRGNVVEATVSTGIDREFKLIPMLQTNYGKALSKCFTLQLSASTIERRYPTGVYYASRGRHLFTSQGLSFRFGKRIKMFGQVSNTFILESSTARYTTNILDGSITFRTPQGNELTIASTSWDDRVEKSFDIKGLPIPQGHYTFHTHFVRYSHALSKVITPYAEAYVGSHYQYERTSLRAGSHLTFSNAITTFADAEYTRLGSEGKTHAFLLRHRLEVRASENTTASLFALSNGFMKLSAIIASLGWKTGQHQFAFEYRDLRDRKLKYVLNSDPFFTSRLLIKYYYQFARI
jgi:hypothetical protein